MRARILTMHPSLFAILVALPACNLEQRLPRAWRSIGSASREINTGADGTRGAAISRPACTVHEVSRKPLVLDGNHLLYVEPVVLSASADRWVLLAGTHNHLFENTSLHGWQPVPADSVFGAVLSSSGQSRIVRSPVPMRLVSGIRAVARPDGGWSVIFAEVKAWSGDSRPDTAARIWTGVLTGDRWTALDTIPLPGKGVLHPLDASSLTQNGSDLAWAMPYTGTNIAPGIAVYERRRGRWAHEIVRTGYAQADLAYSDRHGLVMAVEQADFRLPGDGNSLLLWTRDPSWRILRSVVPGTREEVHHPSLALTQSRSTLTWEAASPTRTGQMRREAHAVSGWPADSGAQVMLLDSNIVPMHPISFIPFPRGPSLWLTDHLLPEGKREIRIVRDSAGTPDLVEKIPNPYFTPFRAVRTGLSELLVSGGVLDREKGAAYSLLLRMRVRCPAGAD